MKTVAGFTLIEMMIAIAVLAIILGIAVPSFRDLIEDNRVTTATNELVGALQIARSEAVKRRQNVVVCRRNGDTCDEDGTDWGAGWLIHNGGNVIRVWEPRAATLTLTGPNGGITFQASGLAAAAASFTVTPSPCSGDRRTVDVSATGRVSSTRTTCS